MDLVRDATHIRSKRVLLDGSWEPADVTIASGTITEIGPYGSARRPIDLGAHAIAPGFIDVQSNGGFGHDFTLEPEAIWDVASRLPSTGVTAFLPTVVTSPEDTIPAVIEAWRNRPSGFVGAEPLGLHIEGPMLAHSRRGAHNPDLLRRSVDTDRWAPPAIRLVTLASEVAGLDVIRDLRKRGIVVALGHSAVTFEQANLAFSAGASHVTHLFNAMSPLTHREPGLAGATLASADVTAGVIVDGIHVHPAVVKVTLDLLGPDRFVTITDAMAAAGMPPGDFQVGPMLAHSDGKKALLADGTLAGSVLTMDSAVRNLIEMAGASPAAAVTTASSTPARRLGDVERGQIARGRRADLVILNPDWSLQATVIGGSIVHGEQLWE